MPLHFLVIEDDPGIVAVYDQKLKQVHDFFPKATITFTSNLDEARKIAKSLPYPDFTILDLTLPGSAWYETLLLVPEFSAHSPLLIISGQPEEKIRAALNSPDIPIVQKSPELFFGTVLLEKIGSILNLSGPKVLKKQEKNLEVMREILSETDDAPPPQ